jgi:chromosomal replication initiation ATPase DnaA
MTDFLEAELAQRRRDCALAAMVAQMVSMTTGVSAQSIISPRRVGTIVCRARYLAMYLAHVTYGWPLRRVGAAFQRDRSTVGIACRWVEDQRDDARMDAMLEHLEVTLRQAADAPVVELAA